MADRMKQGQDISWRLQRYARFLPKEDPGKSEHHAPAQHTMTGKWKYFLPCDGGLTLTLYEGHQLVVNNGPTILESCFLRNASHFLKAFTKTDSILFVYKVKNETRRFRVKFDVDQQQTSDENCANCVQKLSSLIPVKSVGEDASEDRDINAATHREQLRDDVSLSELAKVATHDLPADLPAIYRHPRVQQSTEEMSTLIRLCLTDPTFPSFVDSVEKELKLLTNEN